jgi:UPF0755 protein
VTEPHLEESIFGAHEDRLPQTRRERHARRRRRRPRRLRKFVAMLVSLAVVGGGAYLAYAFVEPIVASFLEPNDFAGPGTGQVQVVVDSGDSGRTIAGSLVDAGVIKTVDAFLEASQGRPQEAASIQPGAYTLKKEMRADDALSILADPENRQVPRVTIPEGLWASEIYERLSKATDTPVKDYKAAAKKPKALGLPAAAEGNVEGYLFPASYEFPVKAGAKEQLTMMVDKAKSVIDDVGIPAGQLERTMTVASIVEGEVSGHADRAKVARVIENRLAHTGPPTYGLLQMDSTVHYATHKRGKAGTTDAERNSDSPYNTYKVRGLPPGPINNPGAASIKAAANPAAGDWLYFVTVDPSTGETKFATTYSEHQQNVAQFQEWCSNHPDEC